MKILSKYIGSFLAIAALVSSVSVQSGPLVTEGKSKPAASSGSTKGTASYPSGFGALKLGMTREQVESIPAGGDIYFTVPLAEQATKPTEGVQKLKSLLQSPLKPEPSPISLKFEGGVLTYFSIDLTETTVKTAEAQLTAKYGPPTVQGDAEPEQCIFRNGNNFKMPQSIRNAVWAGKAADGQLVRISAISVRRAICPTDYFMAFDLTFERPGPSELPKKNVF